MLSRKLSGSFLALAMFSALSICVSAADGYDSLPNPAWAHQFCTTQTREIESKRIHEMASGHSTNARKLNELQSTLASGCAMYNLNNDFSAWAAMVSSVMNSIPQYSNAALVAKETFPSINDIPAKWATYAIFLPAPNLSAADTKQIYGAYETLGAKFPSQRAAIWLTRQADNTPDKPQVLSACKDYLKLGGCENNSYLFVSDKPPREWSIDHNSAVVRLTNLQPNQISCFLSLVSNGTDHGTLTMDSVATTFKKLQEGNILVRIFSDASPASKWIVYLVATGLKAC